jgi:hypothetical protein
VFLLGGGIMPRVIVVIQFNDAYLRFGLTLLRSLEKYAKNAIKVAYTVNLSNEQISELKKECPELIVINSKVRFLRGRFLRNYMANRKVGIFKDAIARFSADKNTVSAKDFYIMLDTDLLLRAPIEFLLNRLEGNQVGLIYREAAFGFHVKFNSSIVVVSGDGVRLVDEWDKQMKHRWVIFSTDEKLTLFEILRKKKDGSPRPLYVRKWKWFWDQITLFEAVKKTGIKYATLEADNFINSNFDIDAAIWSGHNEKKDIVYQKFLNE